MSLVPIAPPEFDVDLELAYATPDNFTGKPIYGKPLCFLHPDAAEKLRSACDLARRVGLRIRIYDAFRPSEAQWRLWEHTPDPDYIADPRRGSPHSRGVAVDLTLLDDRGTPLDMGTAFDDLSAASHHGSAEVSAQAQRNRFLLMGLMTDAGWDFYRHEWWHYQLFDARAKYPVLSDADAPEPMM